MNKGTIINLNKNDFFGFFRHNRIVFMLTITVFLGILISCLTFSKSSVLNGLGEKCFSYITEGRQGESFLNIFTHSLIFNFLLLLVYFLCGTSLMGIVMIPMLTFSYGFIYGVISSYLCETYLLKGIVFNALILLPPAAILVIVILIAGKKSINFSFEFIKLTMPNNRPLNLFLQFKEFCTNYLIYFSLCLVSALIDGLLSKALISYFDLI